MELTKRVTAKEFYNEYYSVLNSILKLTDLELNILCLLSILKNKQAEVLNSEIRTALAKELKISKASLNNYISALVKKKILLKEDKEYDINPRVYIPLNKKEYSINFNFIIV